MAALKTASVPYEMHSYQGTQHGFHNDSTPRYNEAAAKLSWDRTVAFFKKHLARLSTNPGFASTMTACQCLPKDSTCQKSIPSGH